MPERWLDDRRIFLHLLLLTYIMWYKKLLFLQYLLIVDAILA